jgi:hypothetical protein
MKIEVVKRPSKRLLDMICPWILDSPSPDGKRTA